MIKFRKFEGNDENIRYICVEELIRIKNDDYLTDDLANPNDSKDVMFLCAVNGNKEVPAKHRGRNSWMLPYRRMAFWCRYVLTNGEVYVPVRNCESMKWGLIEDITTLKMIGNNTNVDTVLGPESQNVLKKLIAYYVRTGKKFNCGVPPRFTPEDWDEKVNRPEAPQSI